MVEPISLSQLNAADCQSFTQLLADIFEHSPWIPRRAWEERPFESVTNLHAKMTALVDAASVDEQLALLKAHPDLAGKEAQEGSLTDLSSREQAHVGMNALSADEMAEVGLLNAQYREKFGFPFIIAVRDNTKQDIFRKWRQRLSNDLSTETQACLEQVYLIAKLRLALLTGESIN